MVLFGALKRCSLDARHWSSMPTFGVRRHRHVFFLVVTDVEETCPGNKFGTFLITNGLAAVPFFVKATVGLIHPNPPVVQATLIFRSFFGMFCYAAISTSSPRLSAGSCLCIFAGSGCVRLICYLQQLVVVLSRWAIRTSRFQQNLRHPFTYRVWRS